jgi:hypothetical protein
MDDVRRQDTRIFVRELVSPGRAILTLGGAFVLWNFPLFERGPSMAKLVTIAVVVATAVGTAYASSLKKRFLNKRYEALWNGCRDRLFRFQEVLRKMRREQILELNEVPRTIHRTADSIYYALRRADIISDEVQASERGLYAMSPVWTPPVSDPQSTELYRIADKNIAEYKQGFAGVMAGVHRTEAQSAVFMTTVDTLRMRLLGFRLVGRSPELSSHDFLEALAEAKVQLQSIDHALEELDLGPYPKTIAVQGDSPDIHLGQGQ